MNIIFNPLLTLLVVITALFAGITFIVPLPLEEFGPPTFVLLAGLCVAVPLVRSRRVTGIGVASLLRRTCRFAMLLMLALCCLQPIATHALGTNLFRPVNTDLINFTNAGTGVGSLNNTNAIHQLTNGSTTVTSSWVRLQKDPNGIGLWAFFSPTNALMTNAVLQFRFSPDGTNAANEPVFTWRTETAAIAVGRYGAHTNLPPAYVGNAEFIQLWKVIFTNGVDNLGSVFMTNRGPTVAVSQFKD